MKKYNCMRGMQTISFSRCDTDKIVSGSHDKCEAAGFGGRLFGVAEDIRVLFEKSLPIP